MMTKSGLVKATRSLRSALKASAFSVGLVVLATTAACSSPEERLERYTKSGQEYLEAGDLGRANVQFQNALKIDEEHIPALVGLSELAEQRQDFRAMFGIMQRIVRLDDTNADAHVKIGKLYLIGGDTQTALESAERSLELAPGNPDGLALKAAVRLKLDDVAGAVALAREAIEKDPASIEAATVLVTERVRADDPDAALAHVDRALELNPDAAVMYLLRLQILSNIGRTEEMLAGFRDMITRFPEEAAYRKLFVRELVNRDMFPEAKAQLEEVVRLSPGEVEPVLDVVRLEYRINGEDAAAAAFERYVAGAPDNIELNFRYADFLRQQGDIAGAEAIYQTLSRRDDQGLVLRARNEIAAVRLMQGQQDEAEKIVAEILRADPMNSEALLKRAGLTIEAGDYDTAILDLRTVLNTSPDSTAAKLLMATAFERKGDMEFARSQLAQAVAESENAPGASNLYAQFLVRRGDPARAEQVLLDALARNPSNIDSLKLLASVRLMRQDWRGAEETARAIETVSAEDTAVERILGAAYAGLGDNAGAIEALAEAHARSPLGARPLGVLVQSYVNAGRADEAEALLQSMVAADGDNYGARMLLARVYDTQGRRDALREALENAVASAPARPEAREALYRYHLMAGDIGAAETVVMEGVAAAPDNDGLKMLKADFMITSGRREEAVEIYADVLTRRPNDLLAANNYASLLTELRDDQQSRARALEVAGALKDSENPYFLDTYGWALHLNGEHEEAAAALEKAVEGAPGVAEIAYHLGAAYLAAGETEKGRAKLEEVAASGDDAFARRARDLLTSGG